MSLNYVDLDIMTRGTGDTELEPSEEFPILFGLLTAPMTTSGSGGSMSKPHSYLSKFSLSQIPQIEADSSARSEDDSCISEDDTSSSIFSDTIDDDSMDTDTESTNSNEAVSSSPKNIREFYRTGKRSETEGDTDDTDAFPTSTTVDDEDFDDLMISRSRPLHILTQHQNQLVNSNSNNSSRVRTRSRALKRSYDQMIQGTRSRKDVRPNMRLVDVQVHDRSCASNSDTEDDEIKEYCLAENGIQQRLRLFQLNKLVSYASNVSPLALPHAENTNPNNISSPTDTGSGTESLFYNKILPRDPLDTDTVHSSLLPKPQKIEATTDDILSKSISNFNKKLTADPDNYFCLAGTKKKTSFANVLPPAQDHNNIISSSKPKIPVNSFTPWSRVNEHTTQLTITISHGNQTLHQAPDAHLFTHEESVQQPPFDMSFKMKQSARNNIHTNNCETTNISACIIKEEPIDIDIDIKDAEESSPVSLSIFPQKQTNHKATTTKTNISSGNDTTSRSITQIQHFSEDSHPQNIDNNLK